MQMHAGINSIQNSMQTPCIITSPENTSTSILSPTTDSAKKPTTAPTTDAPHYMSDPKIPEFLWKQYTKGQAKMRPEERIKKQSQWISNYTIYDCKLNEDKTELESIGGLPIDKITTKMLQKFCQPYQFPPIDGKRNKDSYCAILVESLKSEEIMEKLQKKLVSKIRSTKSSSKPIFIKHDGTLFRVINVITSEEGKRTFIKTMQDYDREDIDSNGIRHEDYYTHLHGLYENTTIDQISSISKFSCTESDNSYINKTMDHRDHDPKNFDKLNVKQFKITVDYIVSSYRTVRGWKTRSGQHLHFANFIHGKIWLLYMHQILESLGDRDLINCCYSQLEDDVLLLSSDMTNEMMTRNNKGKRKGNLLDESNEILKKQLLTKKSYLCLLLETDQKHLKKSASIADLLKYTNFYHHIIWKSYHYKTK